MEPSRVAVHRVTAVLLVTSTALLVPGLVGIGGSLPLAAVFVGAGGALALVRGMLASLPSVAGCEPGRYAPDLPFAAALAAITVVVFSDASPAELQALGGLAGVVAIANYFFGPVYLYVYGLVNRASRQFGS